MDVRRVARLLAATGLLAVLAGCGTSTGRADDDVRVDLEGAWILETGRDAEGALPGVGRPVTLVVGDREVGGSSACNAYFATLTVNAGTVSFEGIGGTEMACDPEVMGLEQRYTAALAMVETAERADGGLTLAGPDVVLAFTSEPPVADAVLVGTTWVLESVVDGDSVSTPVKGGELTLLRGGLMVADVGCGQQRGRYVLDGDTVLVEAFRDRDAAAGPCPDDVEAQHDHAVRVLRDRFTAEIEGDRLMLRAQSGLGLDFRRG